MYKYETHLHTNLSSACSRLTTDDIINLYTKNGYTGVIVTDHFLNGNCKKELRDNSLPFKDRILGFIKGYEDLKKSAEGKLDVFLGLEYSYAGTDVLLYGFSVEELINMPEIMDMDMRTFIKFANEKGYLTIQAHPFREAFYIDHIRLYSDVQGIEIYNACREKVCNDLGKYWAKKLDKIPFSGSDIHWCNMPCIGGMKFDHKLKDIKDFVAQIKNKKGKLIKQKNAIYDEDKIPEFYA